MRCPPSYRRALQPSVRNRLLKHSRDVRHGPGGTAEVERALLADVSLDDLGQSLRAYGPGCRSSAAGRGRRRAEESDDTSVLVSLPLLAVAVLFALVARAHVQQDGADLLALGLLQSAVLDEGAEGRQTSTQTGHDEGLGGLGGQLHHGRLDADGDGGAGSEAAQVAGGLAEAVAALGVGPVDGDDHQGHGGRGDLLAGGDGVLAALHGGDDADDLVEIGMRGGVLEQDVGEGDGVDLGAALELGGSSGPPRVSRFFFSFSSVANSARAS